MNDNKDKVFQFKSWQLNTMYFFMIVGVIGLVVGFLQNPLSVWSNMLINGFYFVCASVFSIFILSVFTLTGARWHQVFRRVPEAIMGYLPVAAALLLLSMLGIHAIYPWTDTHHMLHDHLLAHKAGYLSVWPFMMRMIIILGIWMVFAVLFRKISKDQDFGDHGRYEKKMVILSSVFVVVFAYSFSLACFDWIMSTEPHWTTTMFAIYNFSGAFVNGLVVVSLTCYLLYKTGYLRAMNANHFHDLGKLIFAFSFFWAYIWFCQFMLIWYGNIPEETSYYAKRLAGDWSWLFYFNFFINFFVPFLVLLPRASKRSPTLLMRVCVVLLVGHWLDVYLMVVPGLKNIDASIGFTEVSMSLGYGALFVLVVGKILGRMVLMPKKSPYLAESLNFHQ